MFSNTGTSTGIDLGSRSIKLARARGNGRPDRLLNACIGEIPDAESWTGAASAALGDLMKQQGLKARDLGRVVASVSGASVQLRQVELPPLDDSELKSSLKYEARKHLSLDPSVDTALDCQVIARAQDGPMNVLMVGVPEAVIQSRIKVLSSVGIEPEVVDAAPLALMNGVYAQPGLIGADTTFALIDVGASGTTIIMARRNGTVYTRTAPPLGDAPEARVKSLASAFKETSQFYASMNERRPVDQVFLAGGGSLERELADGLEASIGIAASTLDLANGLDYSPAGSRSLPDEDLHRLAPQLAVAMGLLYWGAN